jgi:hypothetical protein
VRYARTLVLEQDDAAYADLREVFSDAEVVELGCFATIAIVGVILSRSLRIEPAPPPD